MAQLVDQDRLAGSRILIGSAPTAAPIDTEVTSLDTGRSRLGHSEVVDSDWSSQVLFYGGSAGTCIPIFDSLDGGSASMWWKFEGTRANGDPWHFERGNRYAYGFALADDAAYSVAIQLDALLYATDEEIEVDERRGQHHGRGGGAGAPRARPARVEERRPVPRPAFGERQARHAAQSR